MEDPEGGKAGGGVLQIRGFRYLFAAATVSNFGNMLHAIALPFVAVAVLDASPADIAVLSGCGLLPGFLLGLLAATWVDRLPRRPILVATDWSRALLVLWVPFAAWQGVLTLLQLDILAACLGLLGFLFNAAHHAILPGIVGDTRLIEANGRLKAGEAVSEGAAFASGGWLVEWLTAPLVLGFDAISFAASGLLLRGVRTREKEAAAGPEAGAGHRRAAGPDDVLAQLRAGLVFLLRHRLLRPSLIASAAASMAWSVAGTVYLIYVYEELGFAAGVLGMVFAAGGVASALGALVAERITTAIGLGPALAVGLLGVGAATLLLPLAPPAGALALALLVAHQLGDGFAVLYEVDSASLRQRLTPGRLLGRVGGGVQVAESGGMLLGLILGGALGELLGLRATLVAAGAAACLGAAVVALSPLRRVRRLADLDRPSSEARR